jgi:hypothetical protein
VGNLNAESDFFAAKITFCHGGTSFARDAMIDNKGIIAYREKKSKNFFDNSP